MPEKYHIKTQPVPPRRPRIGKHGVVDWREDCARCHNCVKKACVYDRYRQEADYIRNLSDVDALFLTAWAVFPACRIAPRASCACPSIPNTKSSGTNTGNPTSSKPRGSRPRPRKFPFPAPVIAGRFPVLVFDSMWTDMSEIVRPTRDGIHGREYISTSVDIGRKPSYLSLNGNQSIAGLPPLVSHSDAVDH
jgi:hypothetical protein